MDPEERAREGVFLAFQYPVEIPGVSTSYFLKAAVNSVRKHQGLPELDAVQFSVGRTPNPVRQFQAPQDVFRDWRHARSPGSGAARNG